MAQEPKRQSHCNSPAHSVIRSNFQMLHDFCKTSDPQLSEALVPEQGAAARRSTIFLFPSLTQVYSSTPAPSKLHTRKPLKRLALM
jgi:hypothetical protein